MFEWLTSRFKTEEVPVEPNISWNTSSVQVITSEGHHSNVSFPASWMTRVQTPIKRPPAGKMWSQPDWSRSDSWGGPKR
jgi:hypothetical protein